MGGGPPLPLSSADMGWHLQASMPSSRICTSKVMSERLLLTDNLFSNKCSA